MSKYLRLVAIIIVAIIGFCLCKIISEDKEVETFARATEELLQKLANEFKVVRIVNLGNSRQLDDEMNEIIRSSNGDLVLEVFRKVPNETFNCFMMFDSLADYDKGFEFSKSSIGEMKIVVNYIRNATTDEISEKMDHIWKTFNESFKFYTQNVYILHRNSSGFIDLIAINRVINDSLMRMTTVNRFSIAKQEWQPPLKELKPIDNFQGSNVDFQLSDISDGLAVGPSKHKFSHKQRDHILSGYMIEIIHELAKIGHFKANYALIEEFIVASKSQNNLKFQYPKSVDMEKNLEKMILNYLGKRLQTSLIYKELYFTIPPADRFTGWEIVFLAFDITTWSLISLTLLVAFIVVAVIGFKSKSVRSSVFGENVSTPSLNILAAFFGIPQTVLPQSNFARFLLISFIIWSLLIRTCYVSVLFEYLKGDIRKAPIKSIDEMLGRNFTYFIFQHHCIQMGIMKFQGRYNE